MDKKFGFSVEYPDFFAGSDAYVDEDGMSRTMLVAAAFAVGMITLPMQAGAEYNPGVQVRYDAQG